MSFNPGDVVRLKSGGLPMTVVETRGIQTVCAWMKPDGEVTECNIFAVVLMPIAASAVAPTKTPKRCECGHPLSRHRNGECVGRNKDQSPCTGKCRIVEAGET